MKGSFRRKALFVAGFVAAAIMIAVLIFRPASAGAQSIQTYVLMADQWG